LWISTQRRSRFYERLTSGKSGQSPVGAFGQTPLLDQTPLQLMPKEAELVREHLEEYQSLGIEIEPFGENTFRVTALPAFLSLPPSELVTALVENMSAVAHSQAMS